MSSANKKRLVVGLVSVLLLVALRGLGALRSFELLDARLYYSFAEAQALVAGLGEAQRAAYLRLAALDLGFIALYTFALVRLLPRQRLLWPALWVAPWATAAADLTETLTTALVLLDVLGPEALRVSVVATPLKWSGVAVCLGALVTRRFD